MLVWECIDAAMASEGGFSTEPLIDHDGQCVLIAGGFGLPHKLFRGHIDPAAEDLLPCLRCLSHDGDAKVGYLQASILSQQNVLWFDVTVCDTLLVRVVEGRGDLAYVLTDGREWQWRPLFVSRCQRATGGVGHDQIGSLAFDAKTVCTDDMLMVQLHDCACFLT